MRLPIRRWLYALLFSLLVLGFSLPAQTPGSPVLRIEARMHTAAIKRIATDKEGRFLVTASEDKTARVWELSSGRLLRVLRPPIGAGHEGELNAVALSPDGKTVALGGYTGDECKDKQCSVYIFDRASGTLQRRLTGLPNVILHLVFAPDGSRLAATLGGGEGLRVWSTGDWAEAGRDKYGDGSYGADFDTAGRLVTSCRDGYVRLYDKALHRIKVSARSGRRPYSVRFAPDGKWVAVGYEDSTRVDVLDGATLAVAYSPNTTGVSQGNLANVAWSADGATLYAGGRWNKDGVCPIRHWTEGGRGSYADVTAASDAISDMVAQPRGEGVIFGAYDPAWGVVAADKRESFYDNKIADYRSNLSGFKVSEYGAAVSFSYVNGGKAPAQFTVKARQVQVADSVESRAPVPGTVDTAEDTNVELHEPRTEAHGLVVTDWQSKYEPKLNGRLLNLDKQEMSHSLAITPDEKQFLLGTEYYLRLFDRKGAQVWRVPTPGATWSVNVSGDGRFALAALRDGTIRWYRLKDGKELLALFPHADRKRWVLWTPAGHYDAAVGAEDLIGWHVNNGPGAAADFYPVWQFRDKFYRPDVILQVLATADEQKALALADDLLKKLPPVITIEDPADGTEVSTPSLSVRYRVRRPSGEPVTNIKVLIDGRPADENRRLRRCTESKRGIGLVDKEDRFVCVTLPERDCTIALVAENRFAPSVPAAVRIRWRGPAGPVIRPNLYVLAVGVNQYVSVSIRNLSFAVKDANDFSDALKRQKSKAYRNVEVKLLTDGQATRDAIVDGLAWVAQRTTENDVAMIFLAGHGTNDENNQYFFCPPNFDLNKPNRTGVSDSEITKAAGKIPGKVLFFIDTCHSGYAFNTNTNRGALDAFLNNLHQNGVVVFAAATGEQTSRENTEWKNGAFTKFLVAGLNGEAKSGDTDEITFSSLNAYISRNVKKLTNNRQTPTLTIPKAVSDFPLAFVLH